MRLHRLLGAAALALVAFTTPAWAQDTYTLTGKIEKIDREGRLFVSGHQIVVDDDTEIIDQLRRATSAPELTPGVEVEVTCEDGFKGTRALVIIATLMR